MPTVRNILLAQAATAIGLALAVWIWLGSERAIPTLLGGLIGVVPNAFLAARVMSPRAGSSAKSLLRAGWLGEVGKLAIALLNQRMMDFAMGLMGPEVEAAAVRHLCSPMQDPDEPVDDGHRPGPDGLRQLIEEAARAVLPNGRPAGR